MGVLDGLVIRMKDALKAAILIEVDKLAHDLIVDIESKLGPGWNPSQLVRRHTDNLKERIRKF